MYKQKKKEIKMISRDKPKKKKKEIYISKRKDVIKVPPFAAEHHTDQHKNIIELCVLNMQHLV